MRTSSASSPFAAEPDGSSGTEAGTAQGGSGRERPIDLVHLSRQTFGDKRLETELLRLFVRQSEQTLASLDYRGPEHLVAQPACDLLHMLLGSARVVGANIVAAIAQQLEAETRHASSGGGRLAPADRMRLHHAMTLTNGYIARLLEPN